MKVVFVGSGAFGVPTLRALAEASSHELVGVLTKPGKPAGRGQKIRQTPVFDAATEYALDLATPNSINDDSGQEWLDQRSPDALVVIAYERLLTKRVLSGRFACNLHASLLPRWRGAAPIHRAVLAGDQDIGVSVIELASSMDGATLRLNANNIFDKEYVEACFSANNCYYGYSREIIATLDYQF